MTHSIGKTSVGDEIQNGGSKQSARNLRRRCRDLREQGFTLTEILVAVAIVGSLAAIAIPVTMNQQARAADVATRSDLTNVSTAIESALLTWRGAPIDGALNICHNDATFPSENSPTNTCDEGEWLATVASTGNPTDPTLGGKLSPGVSIVGRVSSTGDYCLAATNTRMGAATFHIDSETGQIAEGNCFTAGWVDPIEDDGGDDISPTPTLPDAPAEVTVDVADNVATVRWNGTAGATYAVAVSSQPIKTVTAATTGEQTCVFPSDTCAGPTNGALPPGTYTATIREQGESGWGPGTTVDFGVTTQLPDRESRTPRQITNVYGTDTLHDSLFDPAAATTLDAFIATSEGQQDLQRLIFSAPNAILNSPEAMSQVVASETALSMLFLDPASAGNYTMTTTALNAILASADARDLVFSSPTAMSMLANSRSAMTTAANDPVAAALIVGSAEAMNEISANPSASTILVSAAEGAAALATTPASFALIVNNTSTFGSVAQSSAAMTRIAASSTLTSTVADSFTAMNQVATAPNARNAFDASATAMGVVNNRSMALGKMIAGTASVDPVSVTDVSSIIDSSSTMNRVASTPAARNMLLGSASLGLPALQASNAASTKVSAAIAGVDPVVVSDAGNLTAAQFTSILSNTNAWNTLRSSAAATSALTRENSATISNVAASAPASTVALGNDAFLDLVAVSAPSRAALLSGSASGDAVRASSKYVARFIAGAAGLTPSDYSNVSTLLTRNSGGDWGTVLTSGAALDIYATSSTARSAVNSNPTALAAQRASTSAIAKLTAADAGLNPTDFATLDALLASASWNTTIVPSSSAMSTLASSPAAVSTLTSSGAPMTAVVQSNTALAAILGNTAAVDSIVASEQGMNQVSSYSTSRTAFRNNAYALASIRSSNMAIGKFVAGWSNLSPTSFADISALASNQPSMTSVAGSADAIDVLSGSNVGTQAMAASGTASSALSGSTIAMNGLRDSSIAMTNLNSNATSIAALANSSVAINSMSSSTAAMEAAAASSAAMNAYANSTIAMPAFIASTTAMNALSSNSVSRTAIYNTPYALTQVQSASMPIGKFVAGLAGANPSSFPNSGTLGNSTSAMSLVAASSNAVAAMSGSSVAMSAMSARNVAMTALAASSTAMNILAATPTAMTAIANNAVSAGHMAGSAVASSALVTNTAPGTGVHAMAWATQGYSAMMAGAGVSTAPSTTLFTASQSVPAARAIVNTAVARGNADLFAQPSYVPAVANALGGSAANGRIGLAQWSDNGLYARPAFSTNLVGAGVVPSTLGTWLDHTDAASNTTTSTSAWCIAVNFGGYTVYRNQTGPVASCATQTSIARESLGQAITLPAQAPTAPSATASSNPIFSASNVTLTPSMPSGTVRAEWNLSGQGTSTSTTAFTTNALTSASNDPYGSNTTRSVTVIATTPRGEAFSAPLDITVMPPAFTHTFTNCGVEGTTGPTLAQCQNSYGAGYGFNSNTARFNMTTQGYQRWTVPVTGRYQVTVAGAEGGWGAAVGGNEGIPGKGYRFTSTYELSQGQVLTLIVGQQGSGRTNAATPAGCCNPGGGGGGSVVFNSTQNVLLAAAGGGGGGGAGGYHPYYYSPSAISGRNGSSTTTPVQPALGTGAGSSGSGLGGTTSLPGSFNGATGLNGSYGGFGGGGARSSVDHNNGNFGGAGGGGYTGGAGGVYNYGNYLANAYSGGGGAGSYSATAMTNGGLQSGNGSIVITYLGP